MQQLQWVKSMDGKWLNLKLLDLTHVHATGVYIIWHGGQVPRIVRIGQGNIAGRLTTHLNNLQIMRFAEFGPMMVTWAEVKEKHRRDGIETYLAGQFKPLIKDRLPEVEPLVASSPFV